MKILAIADYLPMLDRASGDLRFYTILKMLRGCHTVSICCYDWQRQLNEIGENELTCYQDQIEKLGVEVIRSSILAALNQERFDVIWFEFYFAARVNIGNVRLYQPQAIVVVDSVDVHFNRLLAKAALSGMREDQIHASKIREDELSTYSRSDFVVVVTKDDQKILEDNIRNVRCVLLPNIHDVPPCGERDHVDEATLLFVGGFRHEPNVDAVTYFCTEIFPKILNAVPHAKLNVIGGSPPESVLRFSSENVSVLGYVPDIVSYYHSATVSVAPLRFGGGMKGKVGEAMAYTVPVVTTTFGAEGFGLQAGEHLIVADNAGDFADQVVRMIKDKELNRRVARAGWCFINEHYSYESLSEKVISSFDEMKKAAPRKLSFLNLIKIRALKFYQKNIKWRLS